MCQVVLLVAGQRGHVETFHEVVALLAVTIHRIIDRARVALLEHGEIEHVLPHEDFFGDADHLVFTVLVEDDDIVEVGAVAHELVFLQARTDKAVGAVDIEFLVGFCHLRGLDGVEIAKFREARVVLAVFVLEELEPVGGHLGKVRQVAVDLLDLRLQTRHQLVGLVLVEFQDALHLDFQQLQDVVLRYLAHQRGVVGRQAVVDMFADGIDGGRLFKFLILIDPLLDKDLFKRLEVELFQKFVLADLEFLTDEVLCAIHAMT